MVFLTNLDPKVGPDILRAIFAIVKEEGLNINAVNIYHVTNTVDKVDKGKAIKLGVYKFDNREEWTEEQKTWYE